ncbi:aminotransferase [Planctomycetales bacterium]|nr:aminotransferase [Planctomycetales bacterium]GHT02406.1 aminotransferase [Planctomycetales bacterium]GHV19053.1 aminotransferase [Planctomycetales bacterium]
MVRHRILSERAAGGKPSATLAIAARAKKMQAEGADVVSFAAGEPDFRTPPHICDAAIKAVNAGAHFYTASSGTPALKKAVCERMRQDIGVNYDTDQVIVSPGAKFSLFLAFAALLDPGDEILLPSPFWVSYPEIANIFGVNVIDVPTAPNFTLTAEMLEAKITPKVKVLVLNSPSNPTGAVVPPEEVRKIAAFLERHGIFCISDEIYSQLVFGDARHISVASVSDYARAHTVVINGCSKTYSMTGWRIGYAVGDALIIDAMGNIQSQSTSNACAIAQAAAVAALTGDQTCVAAMRQQFQERRDLIVRLLNDIDGVHCHSPGGAFYVLPDISAVFGRTMVRRQINTPTDFCQLALEAFEVACVPGEAFGTDRHIRLSYATSPAQIEKGCIRLKEMIENNN